MTEGHLTGSALSHTELNFTSYTFDTLVRRGCDGRATKGFLLKSFWLQTSSFHISSQNSTLLFSNISTVTKLLFCGAIFPLISPVYRSENTAGCKLRFHKREKSNFLVLIRNTGNLLQRHRLCYDFFLKN